jgi:hypothetical protein
MADLLGVPIVNATLEVWYSPVQVLKTKVLLEHWAEPELEKQLWLER